MSEAIKIRPSSAGKWVPCPGSATLEQGRQEGDTSAADEGTVAHWIAALLLTGRGDQVPGFGKKFYVLNKEVTPADDNGDYTAPVITFTQEMFDHVFKYYSAIRETIANQTFIEQPFDMSGLLGYDDAIGTPDCVQMFDDRIVVHDLKYGMKPVSAEGNLQLACYAWAVYEAFQDDYILEEPRFTLVIHQPRLRTVDIMDYSLTDMQALWGKISIAAYNTKHAPTTQAGPHCYQYYCKAQAICPAFQAYVLEDMPSELTKPIYDTEDAAQEAIMLNEGDRSNDVLAEKLSKIEAIRKWCDAIEQEAYTLAVERGERIPGFKVVEGKAGNRKWSSDEEVTEVLKSMRIKHEVMYDYKLASPTSLEKQFKAGAIGPRQWPKLQDMIVRSEGSLKLVAESDKRPAVQVMPMLDDMPDLQSENDDLLGEV